ncbi:MAG: hypothetical protein Q9187_004405 [Circinaria calcarea]
MSETQRTHKAITLRKIEGKPGQVWYPLQALTLPTPTPTPTQLLLRPTHIALNHRDLFLRQHLYPSPSFTTPLFSDACCVLIPPASAQDALDSYGLGSSTAQRVLLNPGHGWIADPAGPEEGYGILGGTSTNPLGVGQEKIAVEREEVVECPRHLSGPEAAALPLVGLTAWRALVGKSGAAGEGSHILITGIGGGVALMVLLFAVKMGVRAWVTSGDDGKISKAKVLGAMGGVNYKEDGWERKLKAMLPQERVVLDAIIDGAGGDIVEKGVRLLKHGGILVSYGMTLSPRLSLPMSAVLKNLEVRGSTMGSRREFRDMVAYVAERGIRPVVSRVARAKGDWGPEDLEAVEGLFADMKAGRQFGKLVVKIEGLGEEKGKEERSQL